MASGAMEKTADDLRKEIQELQRQQREITERLRDPRGLRRAGLAPGGPRPIGGPRQRGVVRPAVESEDQPAPKRRLLSAIVKVDGGETKEDESDVNDAKEKDPAGEVGAASSVENSNQMAVNSPSNGGFRRDGNARSRRMDFDIPTESMPRNLPKDEDPSLVKRNKRMLGQLLGTLEKFREEDKQLSATEAYMRRSDSLRRAEQKAREESERLRQQEREQIAEKRRRDLTLRARVAAKAEEKKLELLFLLWAEHHKKLSNFVRTEAEPPIYYMPAKPLVDDPAIVEQHKQQVFLEWKSARRAELSEYQKQIEEQHISNVEKELERWQNARNARRANNLVTLQETMDKELETHKLEHGPKTRRIPGGNDDEEDVEDIAAEDELMDEVLEVHERIDGDTAKLSETGNTSPNPVEMQ
uniref:Pinin n=1 Tax=Elaeis guineensis var. tenera TaxID=51953 RepID=A0A6I9QKM7_ELAGV|nr:pinin [Elaeis guineensis]